MKEIPILYSTAMIQAKLAGRKTQTRRILKMKKEFAPDAVLQFGFTAFTPERHISVRAVHANGQFGESFIKCPYGQPGDLLYARETHYYEKYFNGLTESVFCKYKADYGDEPVDWNWRPNIFLHKDYCRIWDRVVAVRAERLQDITEEDAIAEGLYRNDDPLRSWTYQDNLGFCSAVHAYQYLWESINGPGSWEANPWVWRIQTENLSLTGKPEKV